MSNNSLGTSSILGSSDLLQKVYKLASGQGEQVLNELSSDVVSKTFDPSNFDSFQAIGGPFNGTPNGGQFSDTSIAASDARLKSNSFSQLQSQLGTFITFFTSNPIGNIQSLIQKVEGLSPKAALEKAKSLTNAIFELNPQIIDSAVRKASQLASSRQYQDQMAKSIDGRAQALKTQIDQVVQSFSQTA